MAFSKVRQHEQFEAGADLSSHKFKIVELNTLGKVVLAQRQNGDGVLQNIPRSGEAASVAWDGITKVIAGEALSIGDYITAISGGWAINIFSGDLAPAKILGRIVVGAASGGIASMIFQRAIVPNVVSGSFAHNLQFTAMP